MNIVDSSFMQRIQNLTTLCGHKIDIFQVWILFVIIRNNS